MRLHSDSLDALDVRKAARVTGVYFTRFNLKGSRSREQGFDVILTGSSGHRQGFGGPDEAASWDEWGIFLGILFDLDPTLCATGGYESAEHFHWTTGNRFRNGNLRPAEQHKRHNWKYSGKSVTGTYHVSECGGKNGCGAIRRWLDHGKFASFAEFTAATS